MNSRESVEDLVDEITTDAYGDEGYWAFLTAFQDALSLPLTAKVIGESVDVTKIDFDGDERRGLTVTVRRKGRAAKVSILDVVFPARSEAARYLKAYRRWLG